MEFGLPIIDEEETEEAKETAGRMVTDYPFECDPTDQNNQCFLYFDVDPKNEIYEINNRSVPNDCKCSLDNDLENEEPNRGYCNYVYGTDVYKDAVLAYTKVLSLSSCHTLDRDSLRA